MTDFWKSYWENNEITKNRHLQSQVGRTVNKKPVAEEVWSKTIEFIVSSMNPIADDVILDLCAGNGLLSVPFSQTCRQVIAVDISENLLNNIDIHKFGNIRKIKSDVLELNLPAESIDKAILYFALQHFDLRETIILFGKVYNMLKAGGTFYIGDIPDEERIWEFYDTPAREKAYFESVTSGNPIIGQWFTRSFIQKAALFNGFTDIKIIDQPAYQINSHYRFDVICIK